MGNIQRRELLILPIILGSSYTKNAELGAIRP